MCCSSLNRKSGFEAWSSIREPSQCLDLLETIYDALDSLAKKQGIFKVESTVDHYTGMLFHSLFERKYGLSSAFKLF